MLQLLGLAGELWLGNEFRRPLTARGWLVDVVGSTRRETHVILRAGSEEGIKDAMLRFCRRGARGKVIIWFCFVV